MLCPHSPTALRKTSTECIDTRSSATVGSGKSSPRRAQHAARGRGSMAEVAALWAILREEYGGCLARSENAVQRGRGSGRDRGGGRESRHSKRRCARAQRQTGSQGDTGEVPAQTGDTRYPRE